MGEWHMPPESGEDELAFGIFDRKSLDMLTRRRGAPPVPAPEGFIPERLMGDQRKKTSPGRRPSQDPKMLARAELIRDGKLTYTEIAERYGVTPSSISDQARRMGMPLREKGRPRIDGRTRTTTEAASGRGARGQCEPQALEGRSEDPSEAAA